MRLKSKGIYFTLTVSTITQRASCKERSASSSKWLEAPLRMILHAFPEAVPENLMTLSSPIINSSIKSQYPNLALSGLSKVERMSPPVT
jgi:hypothetical protein